MQVALFVYGVLCSMAFAQSVTVDSIGIYDSTTDDSKAVLEVCYSNKECDKLLLSKKDLNSKKVEEWFDMVVKKRGAK